MREIKFRAWNKKTKSMGKPFNLEWQKENSPVPDDYTKKALFSDDVIFMQFTGLKDKNGKEIYEGDIIKAVYCHLEIEAIVCKIVYDEDVACFAFHSKQAHRFRYEFRDGYEFEVIGNIHENPELIK